MRKGGMTVKFVQSSDNNYVKFFCNSQNFTTDVTQWQGVDDEPKNGSINLVKSGGVMDSYAADINSLKKEFKFVQGNNNALTYIEFAPTTGHTYLIQILNTEFYKEQSDN